MTAAMQICHRAAFTSQLKFEEQIQQRKLKSLASTLANAVLQFWSSVEVPRELEKTSLGTDKVYDCLTHLFLMFFYGNDGHMVFQPFFSFITHTHTHTCIQIYVYICIYMYVCMYLHVLLKN